MTSEQRGVSHLEACTNREVVLKGIYYYVGRRGIMMSRQDRGFSHLEACTKRAALPSNNTTDIIIRVPNSVRCSVL